MKRCFADTVYWLALTNRHDQHHGKAPEVSTKLGQCRLVTTDAVLTEFLNALAEGGLHIRAAGIATVEAIRRNPLVTVISQSRQLFNKSLALYKARPDKGYSMTDCTLMVVMRDRRLTEALTADHHFVQEGFIALLQTAH
ncbi:MAG: type II toxin-antitoxin system VapC family toxin [Nitrospira sp.]|nr:type II toxin-antitoxin system VapC family toxin [Nitrospira sp.]